MRQQARQLRGHERDDPGAVGRQIKGGQGGRFGEASVDDLVSSAGHPRAEGGHEAADMPRRRARHAVEHGRKSAGDERVAQAERGGAERFAGMDDELHLPAGAARGDHHAPPPVQRKIAGAQSSRLQGRAQDRRASGNLARGFFAFGPGPVRIAQEHRQAGVMRLQRFAQMLRMARLEDRDGAHVSSCQKPAQS